MPKLSGTTKYWINKVARFSFVQLIAQVFSLAGGFLIVRTLSKDEYAYYSLAFSMQSVINVLSDGGVWISLFSIGGQVYKNKHRFGQLINAAFEMRHFLIVAVGLVILPITFFLLTKKGAGYGYSFAIVCLVLVGVYFQLTNSIFSVAPRLHIQLNRIQFLDFGFSFLRFLFIAVLCSVFLNAFTVLLLLAGLFGAQTFFLKRWTRDLADLNAEVNLEDRKDIRKNVLTILPNNVFYCLQGQISIFMITIFGQTSQVADVGALGRLAALFAFMWVIVNNVIMPYFSRCQDGLKLRERYWRIIIGYSIFLTPLVGLAFACPDALLWVLGPKYSYLRHELFLAMTGAAIYSISGVVGMLNYSKGWLRGSWMHIVLTIAAQIAMLSFINVSTTKGVILFGMLSVVPSCLVNFYISFCGFRAFGKAGFGVKEPIVI